VPPFQEEIESHRFLEIALNNIKISLFAATDDLPPEFSDWRQKLTQIMEEKFNFVFHHTTEVKLKDHQLLFNRVCQLLNLQFKKPLSIWKDIFADLSNNEITLVPLAKKFIESPLIHTLKLKKEGDQNQLEQILLRELEQKKKTYGDESLSLVSTLDNLAQLYKESDKQDKALENLQKSLAIRKKLFGNDHLKTADGYYKLGELYYGQAKYSDSEFCFQQALTIRQKSELVPFHQDILVSLHSLAGLYRIQVRLAEAEQYYNQALELAINSKLKEDHHFVVKSLVALAILLQTTGRKQEAIPLFQHALNIERKVLGFMHSYVQDLDIKLSQCGE